MSKKHSLVDGFIPRKSGDELGSLHKVEHRSLSARQDGQRVMYTKDHSEAVKLQSRTSRRTLGRADIDESLNMIDETSRVEDKKKKNYLKSKRASIRPKRSLTKRIIRWLALLILLAVLGVGIYTGVKFIAAGGNIFQGNFFDLMRTDPLRTDSNGRTNILIFGMSPDERQEDPYLTDSMIVLSIDQETKDAFMVSFPRDLWVRYDERCIVGYQGKLNATYLCGSNHGKDNAAGVNALKSKISEISGLDIQYNVSVNWGVLTEVVDTLGGIDVELPEAISDPMTKLKLPKGVSHLNGETALSLSRSRYGVVGGDFGRALNQQRVMKAILDKAAKTGALADLGKITSLIDAFGDNLKTNIEMREVRTFVGVASKVDISSVESLDLADPESPLVNTGEYNGQSIVKPIRGISNFSDIKAAIKKRALNGPSVVESANISVYNGSDIVGLAKREADKLEDSGLTIAAIGNAPAGIYDKVEIYAKNNNSPLTRKALEERFGVKVKDKGSPITLGAGVDFIVIFGEAP